MYVKPVFMKCGCGILGKKIYWYSTDPIEPLEVKVDVKRVCNI